MWNTPRFLEHCEQILKKDIHETPINFLMLCLQELGVILTCIIVPIFFETLKNIILYFRFREYFQNAICCWKKVIMRDSSKHSVRSPGMERHNTHSYSKSGNTHWT